MNNNFPGMVIESRAISGNSLCYDEPYNEQNIKYRTPYKKQISPQSFVYLYNCREFEILKEGGITNQIDFKKISLPPFYYENYENLEISFTKELYRFRHHLLLTEKEVKLKFKNISSIISELPFEKSTVELTKSNGLKFTLLFPKNKLLLITKALGNVENLKDNEIVFSLFINRELIMSNVSDDTNFMEGFQRYLNM